MAGFELKQSDVRAYSHESSEILFVLSLGQPHGDLQPVSLPPRPFFFQTESHPSPPTPSPLPFLLVPFLQFFLTKVWDNAKDVLLTPLCDLSYFNPQDSLRRKYRFSSLPLRRLYFSCLSSTFLLPEQQAQFSHLINLVTLNMGL